MASAHSPASLPETFRVGVLGPFTLSRNDQSLDTSRWQGRVETLFKLLVTAPERRRLRDEIIDIIWPDAPPDAAAGNLRVVVHRLRQALGGGTPSPVVSEGGWILLNGAYGWDIDLDRFQTALGEANGDAGSLLEAAGLLRGEPLPEDRYADWAAPVREHVRRLQRDLSLQIAAVYQARAAYDDAADWLERALEDDPYDEEALRQLLIVLSLAGRRVDAARRYAEFEALLRREMEVAPSGETQAVAARIREDGVALAPAGETGATPALPVGSFLGSLPAQPLVNRQEELERVQFAVDAVESGTGRLIMLAGEAGVGKTRLAQEVSVRLRERQFLVAMGRSYERDRDIPYYPFVDVLGMAQAGAPQDVRALAATRWPELGQLQMAAHPLGEERSRLALAFSDFLIAVTERRPVAVLLDDLQWADEASMGLLQEIAHRTRAHRVLLVGTYVDVAADREGALGRALRDLSREGLVERIPLGRLTLEGTAALVAQKVPQLGEQDDFVDFVYRRTKGNPYFVERMLTALAGRYRLLRQIGAGGMGRVFEAEDTRTDRLVAVKLMFARTEADPRSLRRFEQEGELLAALKHPHIVRVFGHVADEYSGCIVMELLDGQSLGTIMRGDPMPLEEARWIAEQVADALAFAHEHNIVHRDIKPDNIMVDADGVVKVTDFGIARMARRGGAATTLTSTGMTMGTPLYMAPEQVEGQRVDGRADLYSLGGVLYALVTGRPPFVSDDPISIAYKHVHELPPALHSLNGAVPEDWDELIRRALAKDPEERFPSAAAMRDAIRALSPAEGETIPMGQGRTAVEGQRVERAPRAAPQAVGPPPQPSGSHTRTGPRSPRHRLPVAASAAVSIAIVALVAVLAVRALSSKHTAASPTPTAGRAVGQSIPNTWGSSGTAAGQFEGPTGAGTDPQGNLWVADSGNDRVEEFSPAGKVLAVFGSHGSGNGQFLSPTDVTADRAGNVYVADPSNGRVEKFSPALRWIASIRFVPLGGTDGTALSSVALDGRGNLYAADYSRNRVRVFASNGALLRSWGMRGRKPGRFSAPDGIGMDARNGWVYVADRYNNRIQKFTLDGRYLLQWGKSGPLAGQFDQPADVAVDGHGNVYVADTFNHRVQEFDPNGRFIATWGRDGSGYLQFHRPSGVAADARGVVYVTDYYNNRVERIVH